jgi:tetratricopeptide (TPR) repeat protein
MTKLQWAVIAGALALFLVLYLGCDRKPEDIASLETSRALSVESTDINLVIQEAKEALKPAQRSLVLGLEQNLESTLEDTNRVALYKELSGEWYQLQRFSIAGYYAQQVAEVEPTEGSWSIAGTTYSICAQRTKEEKIKEFCANRAVNAFENAISLNPGNVANRVNLALTYTSNPPPDNPMKGVLMLRTLNQEEPNNVLVLNALGRLSIRTGQFDNAVKRLNAALDSEPENATTICLLAQAYEGAGNAEQATVFAEQCRQMRQ